MEFAEEGGEGATPYEVLLHAVLVGDSSHFTRQDAIEQTWRVVAPLLDHPPRVIRYRQGSWGPRKADALMHNHGGWRSPWLPD
jgi:glucose-6-phosphate 1-dehydrogenase